LSTANYADKRIKSRIEYSELRLVQRITWISELRIARISELSTANCADKRIESIIKYSELRLVQRIARMSELSL